MTTIFLLPSLLNCDASKIASTLSFFASSTNPHGMMMMASASS